MFVIVGVYFLFSLTFVNFFWEIRESFRHQRMFQWIVCVLASIVRPTLILCCICFHYRWLLCFGRNVLFFGFFFFLVILYDWQKWYSKYLVTGSPEALTNLNSCSCWLQGTLAINSWGRWVHVKGWVLLVEGIFGASVSSKSLFAFYYCAGNIIDHRKCWQSYWSYWSYCLRWHWWTSNWELASMSYSCGPVNNQMAQCNSKMYLLGFWCIQF